MRLAPSAVNKFPKRLALTTQASDITAVVALRAETAVRTLLISTLRIASKMKTGLIVFRWTRCHWNRPVRSWFSPAVLAPFVTRWPIGGARVRRSAAGSFYRLLRLLCNSLALTARRASLTFSVLSPLRMASVTAVH